MLCSTHLFITRFRLISVFINKLLLKFNTGLRFTILLLVATFFVNTNVHAQFTDAGVGLPNVTNGCAVWGDYNNDGALDVLIIGNLNGTPIARIYRNDNGVFTDIQAGLTGVIYGSAAWGDFNNDGQLDLVISGQDSTGTPITTIYQNYNGTFFNCGAEIAGVEFSTDTWAENSNGSLDLLITGWDGNGPVTKLYYGYGYGIFMEQQTIGNPFIGVMNGSVAIADFNNDGNADILISGFDGTKAQTKIYYGHQGLFTDGNVSLVPVSFSSVACADYNNDGRIDILITGNSNGVPVTKLYRNDDSVFTEVTTGLPNVDSSSVAWGDYNNDGQLDILLSGNTGTNVVVQIYKNINGTFSSINASIANMSGGTVAWGDYDNDGDLDVLITGSFGTNGYALICKNPTINGTVKRANAKPSNPTSLTHTKIGNNSVILKWNKSTDSETPQAGLSYNLFIQDAITGSLIKSPDAIISADTNSSKRTVPQIGNIQWSSNGYPLNNLSPGKYYWSVQAIDAGLQGGNFAPMDSFTIGQPPVINFIGKVAVTSNSCDLIAHVNSNGSPTSVTFQYGTQPVYSDTSWLTLMSIQIIAGTNFQTVTTSLNNLTPGTTYYYRAVATNPVGVTISADSIFYTTNGAGYKIWTGTYGSNWNMPNNWNPMGIPTPIDNVIIQPTSFQPTIPFTAACNSIILQNGTYLSFSNDTAYLAISGDLTSDSYAQLNNIKFVGNNTHQLSGTNVQFGSLTIGHQGQLSLNTNITINSTFNLYGTVLDNGNNINLIGNLNGVNGNYQGNIIGTGNLVLSGYVTGGLSGGGLQSIYGGSLVNVIDNNYSGSVEISYGAPTTIKGDLTINQGSVNLSDTLILYGGINNGSNQNFYPNSVLQLEGSSRDMTFPSNLEFSGIVINRSSSKIYFNGDNNIIDNDLALNNSLLYLSQGTLTLWGNVTFANGKLAGTNGTNLTYSGSTASTVPPVMGFLDTLWIANSDYGVTLGDYVSVNTLIFSNWSTLNTDTFAIHVTGDVYGDGSTYGKGDLVLSNGTSPHQIGCNGSISSLKMDDVSGAELISNLNISSFLGLNNGTIKLHEFDLNLSGQALALNVGPQSFVETDSTGAMLKYFNQLTDFTFPIGHVTYSPIDITFNSAGTTDGGYIKARAHFVKYPLNPSTDSYLKRFWTVNAGGYFTTLNCNLTFNYGQGDVFGNESSIVSAMYDPINNAWTAFNTVDAINHKMIDSNLTHIDGDYTGKTPAATITTQPTNQTVCANMPAIFSIQATGNITGYQWQIYSDGSFYDFHDDDYYTGTGTDSLQINTYLFLNGEQFRCAILTPYETIYSQPVTFTIFDAPTAYMDTAYYVECIGAPIRLAPKITGGTPPYSYNWTGDSISLAWIQTVNDSLENFVAWNNGDWHLKVKVTDMHNCWSADSVEIFTPLPPSVTIKDNAATVCVYANDSIFATVTGNYNYISWGGAYLSNYQNLNTSFNASEYGDFPLQLDIHYGGELGNCVVSDSIAIRVLEPPTIEMNPFELAVCENGSTTFNIIASGDSLSYQWQSSTTYGETWNTITDNTNYTGSTTNTLLLQNVPVNFDGLYVRCVASNTCNSIPSNSGYLHVNAIPTVVSQPLDTTIDTGQSVYFEAALNGNGLNYQWQQSLDAGNTWNTINDGGTNPMFSGSTSSILNLNNIPLILNHQQFRLMTTGICGAPVFTNAAHLTVNDTTPHVLTVTVNNVSKTYGDANPQFTYTITGFINGDNTNSLQKLPVLTCYAVNNSGVGTYDIVADSAYIISQTNYIFNYIDGTLTINPANLTIKANNATRMYGDYNPSFSFTYSGFVLGEDSTVFRSFPFAITPAVDTTRIGQYPITPVSGNADNYNFIYVNGTLTINKAPLTVIPNNDYKIYGQPNPVFTCYYSGFLNLDNQSVVLVQPTLSTPATITSKAGIYPLTASGGSVHNYYFIYDTATFTIEKATLSITAPDTTKVYGQLNPIFNLHYSGFVNGDTPTSLDNLPTVTTDAITYSPVSTYTIYLNGGSDKNYNYSLSFGNLSITPATLTVTPNNATCIYGKEDSVANNLTFTYSGFVGIDSAKIIHYPPRLYFNANNSSNVGTDTIYAFGASADNYVFNYLKGLLTITQAPLTVVPTFASRAYGAPDPQFHLTYFGFINGDDTTAISVKPTVVSSATITSNAGNYALTASDGSSTNYKFSYTPGILSIYKKSLTITAADTSKIYGQTNPVFKLKYSGFVNGDVAASLDTLPTITTTANTLSPVGSYPIHLAGGNAKNYFYALNNGTLTVNKAILNVKAQDTTRIYGATNPSTYLKYTGFVGTDNASLISIPPTISISATNLDSVGSYPIIVSSGNNNNYSFNYVNGTLTITKAPLTVTALPANRNYGQTNPTFSFYYSGFVNGDNSTMINVPPLATTTATPSSNVGSYPITLTGGSDNNYYFNFVNGVLSVHPVQLYITANSTSKNYGQPNPTFSLNYSGFVNGDSAAVIDLLPTITTTAQQFSNVTTYPIVLTGGSDLDYTFVLANGTLTVNPATLTVTAKDTTRVYGANNPTVGVTYSGFVGTDNPNVLNIQPTTYMTTNAYSPVGTYPINASGGMATNYNFNYAQGTLTITKAPLTIIANNSTKMYGQPNPVFRLKYTGFVNGEDSSVIDVVPNIATLATNYSRVGIYTLIPYSGSDNNYSFNYANGQLTVTKAPLTITAADTSKIYGTPNPVFQLHFAGFANGDIPNMLDTLPNINCLATNLSTTGNYPIVLSGGNDSDYVYTLINGTLHVNKATLIVSAIDTSRFYGAPNPTPKLVYTGFVGTDNVNSLKTPPLVNIMASSLSPVGEYAIIPFSGFDNNYNFIYDTSYLTVNKAPLVVTAASVTRIYGNPNPQFKLNYSGFANNENETVLDILPQATTSATQYSNVGYYTIVPTGGSDLNYNLSYVSGNLTITKAPLTIFTNDTSRIYGQANPPLILNYQGFVNNDNASVIDTLPTISCAATATSNTGAYPIVLSKGNDNNYSLNLKNATLTVNKAILTVNAENKSRDYGSGNPPLTFNYSGFVNNDNASVIDLPPTISTAANLLTDAGLQPIVLSGGSDNNYQFNFVNGVLTINKITLSAKPLPATKTYGAPNPVFTIGYSGFVNNDNPGKLDVPPVCTTTTNQLSDVGTYQVSCIGGSDKNYILNDGNGTLQITKAMLTVTADNKSRNFGVANPPLTYTAAGFVNGDDTTVIDIKPVLTTAADINSLAGLYQIFISGASDNNYDFTYVNGTLTVRLVAVNAYAGPDQHLCTDSTRLAAEIPSNGSGTWSVVSGAASFQNAAMYNTIVHNLAQGANTLRWTVVGGGGTFTDDVVIYNDSPSDAVILNNDTAVCASTFNLTAIKPVIGKGVWSCGNSLVQFVDTLANTTTVLNLSAGQNALSWTVTNKNCVSSSNVTVFNKLPYAYTGDIIRVYSTDQDSLGASAIFPAAQPPLGTGVWSLVKGAGTISNNTFPNTEAHDFLLGLNIFQWKVTNECGSDSANLDVFRGVSYLSTNVQMHWTDSLAWFPHGVPSANDSITIGKGTSSILVDSKNDTLGVITVVGSNTSITVRPGLKISSLTISGDSSKLFVNDSIEITLLTVRSGSKIKIGGNGKGAASTIKCSSITVEPETSKGASSQLTINKGSSITVEPETSKKGFLTGTGNIDIQAGSILVLGDSVTLKIYNKLLKGFAGNSNVSVGNNSSVSIGKGSSITVEPETSKKGIETFFNGQISYSLRRNESWIKQSSTIKGAAGNSNLVIGSNASVSLSSGSKITVEPETSKGATQSGNITIGSGSKVSLNSGSSITVEPETSKGSAPGNRNITVSSGANVTLSKGSSITIEPETSKADTMFASSFVISPGASIIDYNDSTHIHGHIVALYECLANRKIHFGLPVKQATNRFGSNPVQMWNEKTHLFTKLSPTGTLTKFNGYAVTLPIDTIIALDDTTLNAGKQLISNLTYTTLASANSSVDGANFISNPYPSGINWDSDSITKTNVFNTVYTWDNNNYSVYLGKTATVAGISINTGSPYIAPMTGFWIYKNNAVPAANGSVQFTNGSRVHLSDVSYQPQTIHNLMRFRIDNSPYSDETVIRFLNAKNTDAFNGTYDAVKRFSDVISVPQLFTVNSTDTLAIQSLPLSPAQKTNVQLGFRSGLSGNYTLQLTEMNFTVDTSLYIKDLITAKMYKLKTTPSLVFSYHTGDAPVRFQIMFNPYLVGINQIANSTDGNVNIYAYQNQIYVNVDAEKLAENSQVYIYNILGELILKQKLTTIGISRYTLNKPVGAYIVKVVSGNLVSTKKVFAGE